ncbi:MAG TPA: hypothetical protein VEV17_09640 [Bryobacteraceae bacterium]|nr:hypothetical protein [Bryobacteraceae bacterium]
MLTDPAPEEGETDHDTAELLRFVTVAENCVDCPPVNDTEEGETETDPVGINWTTALAVAGTPLVVVAITVTEVCDAKLDGAV